MKAEQPDSTGRLLRKREVADKLACSIKTVEREVQDGKKTGVSRGKDAVWRELSLPVLNRKMAEPEGFEPSVTGSVLDSVEKC